MVERGANGFARGNPRAARRTVSGHGRQSLARVRVFAGRVRPAANRADAPPVSPAPFEGAGDGPIGWPP